MRHRLPIALTALLSAHALADTPMPPSYPLLEYRPALAGYVPDRETGLNDWRTANDTVARLGGHAGHARMPAGDHHHAGHDAPIGTSGERPAGERP